MSVAKTKARTAKADSRPKQDFNAINQIGLKAQDLMTKHLSALGPRIPPALVAALAADLAGLTHAVPTARGALHGQVQLTAAQRGALLIGCNLVKGIRTTVKGHRATKEVLVAYGVGTATNKLLVSEVTLALQSILDRVAAEPAEAAALGIVAEDVAALEAALKAIQAADLAQEAARASGPQTTAERNAIARRILDAVKKIAGAGMRTFTSDPTLYANFQALVLKAKG